MPTLYIKYLMPSEQLQITRFLRHTVLCKHITFCVSRRRPEMYCGHARLCVFLSAVVSPRYCTDPDVTWEIGRGCLPSCALLGGFAIGARVALLLQHNGNAWQSPAVIRQANRTPHACRTRTLRMPAKTPLAGDKMDAPAACAAPFHFVHTAGVL